MFEVKGNTLIITVNKKGKHTLFQEVIDFISSRRKVLDGKKLLQFIEDYHKIDRDFRFERKKIYNERLHIH